MHNQGLCEFFVEISTLTQKEIEAEIGRLREEDAEEKFFQKGERISQSSVPHPREMAANRLLAEFADLNK